MTFADKGIITRKYSGQEYTVCPQCSNDRHKIRAKCLSVNHDKGIWNCHHCDFKGRLTEKQIHSKFREDEPNYLPPDIRKHIDIDQQLVEWFWVKRKISTDTLNKLKIKYTKGTEKIWIAFPFYEDKENIVNVKYRLLNEKQFTQSKQGKPILYNLPAIKDSDYAIITEGEIDTLTWVECGYDYVVSCPMGAPNTELADDSKKMDFLYICEDYLSDKTRIYLSVDNDKAGRILQNELARRLDKTRCWVIEYPKECKDINDVLVQFGKEAVKKCFENAKPFPYEGLYDTWDFIDDFVDLYDNGYGEPSGSGWTVFDTYVRLYQGNLITVTGVSSHGKSVFIANWMLRTIALNNWRFAILSPESRPYQVMYSYLSEMVVGKPFSGEGKMTGTEALDSMKWMRGYIYPVYPPQPTFETVLDAFAVAIQRYGVRGLILDPYNSIDHVYRKGENEVGYSTRILNDLLNFIKKWDVTVFLVAHPKKMYGQAIPHLTDISGSNAFLNKSDIGICIHNEKQEDGSYGQTQVHIQKIKLKHLGKCGVLKFDFNTFNSRFYEMGDAAPMKDISKGFSH